MQVQRSRAAARFEVTDDGRGVVGRAGLGLVAEVADRIGLTAGLSDATCHTRSWAVHEPGKVLRDVALTLVDGGDALRHMAVLEGQPELFGTPASPSTTCRTVVAVADDATALAGIAAARKAARAVVWANGGAPPVVERAWARERGETVDEDGGEGVDEPLAVDLDATLSIAHSDDKDGAAATYKRTWGFHPMMAYLDRGDGLGEALAGLLRPGNAGANDAADHITVFDQAVAQLPALPPGLRRLVRSDSAGASHKFVDHVVGLGWQFSTGFALNPDVKDAIRAVANDGWQPTTRQDGTVREGAAVAEITDLVDLSGWPAGSRLIARREPLHPGAQQTLDDIDGYRFTAFLTNQPDTDLATLDTRHRAHARVEDRIRGGKDSGLRTLPCDTFARNGLWLQLVLVAQDLMAFTAVLTLDDDELRLAEPQQLRYKLLHVPARITHHARKVWVRIQHDWPWAAALVAAFRRLRALPLPAG